MAVLNATKDLPPGPFEYRLGSGQLVTGEIDPPRKTTFFSWSEFKTLLEEQCRAESADITVLLEPYNEVCERHGFAPVPIKNFKPAELETNTMMLQIKLQQKIDAAKTARETHRKQFGDIIQTHKGYYTFDEFIQRSLAKNINLPNRQAKKEANFHARGYVNNQDEISNHERDLASLVEATQRIFPKENKLFDGLYPKATAIVKDALRAGFNDSDPMVIHTQPSESSVYARWNWSHPEGHKFLIDSRAFSTLLEQLEGKDSELCTQVFWRMDNYTVDQVAEVYPEWGFCAGWTGYDKYQPAIRPDECLGPKRVMSEFRAFDADTNYDPSSYIALQDYMGELVRNIRAIILLRAEESTALSSDDAKTWGITQAFKSYKVDAESHSTTLERIERLQSPRGLLAQDLQKGSEGAKDVSDLLDALKIFTPKLMQHLLLQAGSFDEKLSPGEHLIYVTPRRANHRHNRKLDVANNGVSTHDLLERNLGCKVRASAIQKSIMNYAEQFANSPWENVILDAAAAALCNVPPIKNGEHVHKNIPVTKVKIITPPERKQEEIAAAMGKPPRFFSLARRNMGVMGPPNPDLGMSLIEVHAPNKANRIPKNGHREPQ
ncbi:MAG TPA: hypothetical protein DIS76_07775 [Rhodospirillaceae bacterium]|nr:hypothetical protein [Rhodospirillaceae bacterium]